LRILLIEDNPIDAQAVIEALEGAPEVQVQHLSTLGARLPDGENPDVVLLDLSLEDTEGVATVRRARHMTGDVPIVVLTGNRNDASAVEVLREGAEDYLSKGAFSRDALLRSVRYAIERHSLKARLSRADRLATVGHLAAGVAHEVSNPASFVLGNLLTLEQQLARLRALAERAELELAPGSRGTAEEMLAVLGDACVLVEDNLVGIDRIAKVTRELQSYSRLGRARASQVDLNAVVKQAANLVRNSFRERATLVMELEPIPEIVADATKLEQVVTNLLVNACHAIEPGAPHRNRVRVTTRLLGAGSTSPTIELSVEDTGCGIPADRLSDIFEPFFTTKPREQGTGLGLSMAREIVQFHGGEIQCSSVEGEGTRFLVSLPVRNTLAVAHVRAETVLGASPVATRNRGRARVLIVDDEPSIRRVLAAFVERHHDVVTRASGEAALELLQQDANFDIVVCDCSMPGLGGAALHAQVSSIVPRLANRFLFCTGAILPGSTRDALERGGNRILLKPFPPSELIDGIALRLSELDTMRGSWEAS
jgi:signal transduction histidine kinase